MTRTFSIGLDVGRDREKVALVRLRLSRALLGAAGTQAMAAGALAIERGVATEQIAAAEGLALRAAAFNGMPDPVLYLAALSLLAPSLRHPLVSGGRSALAAAVRFLKRERSAGEEMSTTRPAEE